MTKVSQLIADLQSLQSKHGDVPVCTLKMPGEQDYQERALGSAFAHIDKIKLDGMIYGGDDAVIVIEGR